LAWLGGEDAADTLTDGAVDAPAERAPARPAITPAADVAVPLPASAA
jgi:hypothetical protein